MHANEPEMAKDWEKKEFTFNITENYIDTQENVRDMSFFVQAGKIYFVHHLRRVCLAVPRT